MNTQPEQLINRDQRGIDCHLPLGSDLMLEFGELFVSTFVPTQKRGGRRGLWGLFKTFHFHRPEVYMKLEACC